MAVENAKHKFVTGVRNLRLAPITEDNRKTLTIGEVTKVAEDLVQKFSINPESSSEKIYGSNKTLATLNSKSGGKISLELASLPESLESALTGSKEDENGIIVYTEDDITPYFALSVELTYNDGTYAVVGLGKVNFELINEEADTKEDKLKAQSYKLEGQVLTRLKDNFYKVKAHSDNEKFKASAVEEKIFGKAVSGLEL